MRAYSMDPREKIGASVKKGIPESAAAYTTPKAACRKSEPEASEDFRHQATGFSKIDL